MSTNILPLHAGGCVAPAMVVKQAVNTTKAKPHVLAMLVLWPHVWSDLEDVAADCVKVNSFNDAVALLDSFLVEGAKASSNVTGYTEPDWPLRSVEAFVASVKGNAVQQHSNRNLFDAVNWTDMRKRKAG